MTLQDELINLTDNTLVLASTERVSRYIKLQAAHIQSLSGKRSWFAKGTIKTVSAWIENAWLDLMPDEQLLYPVQELAVVKAIADRSGLLPATLISSTSTARRVNQAYSQAHKYQIPMDQDRFMFKRELEVFWEWHRMIGEDSKKNGYVFRAELPGRLLAAIEAGRVPVPERIVIVGILSMNPAERAVFEAMSQRGATVVEYAEPMVKATPTLLRASTQADELALVAAWVNKLLLPHVQAPLGAPSIAILVPDMRTYQAPLVEALTLAVSPASLIPAVEGVEVREPWDISSGATLGSRPMIRAAMDCLSLTNRKADAETFSRVLRSRWVGGSEIESANRALMDVWLRENLGLSMTGKDYRRALTRNTKALCPDFYARYCKMLDAQEAITRALYPSEWAEHFEETLKTMGWPETRELSSANYQTLNAWSEALGMFRTLDYQLGPCEYERARMWLREIVDLKQFQPRISHVAPVSIMGYEDAIGLSFEHVWIVGAASSVLPMAADPNPFLPVDLQAAAGIPEANSELSLVRAQKVVSALLGISESITVSCPAHSARGTAISPSELFTGWPKLETEKPAAGSFILNQINLLDRSKFDAESVPPVSDEELVTLRGGVSIFTNYAQSPFFAFAKNRLSATEFPSPVIGLDPRIQGTMLHLIGELFWRDVQKSVALKAMSQDELSAKVTEKIEAASAQLLNKLIWRYGSRLISLEQKRLHALTMEWLAFEAKREHEFEVIGFEENHDIEVAGVPLSVTVDRRDKVFLEGDETRTVVIDYKTGRYFRATSLNADALTEPQLPIYATQIDPGQDGSDAGKIDGVAIAQVHSGTFAFHTRSNFTNGLVSRSGRKGDVDNPPAWDSQCDAWRTALQAMGEGFLAGVGHLTDPEADLSLGYEHLAPLVA